MATQDYYYAVTRVHSRERNLLSEQDLHQLLQADSLEHCFTILQNKGWGSSELPRLDADALIAFETKKTWDFIEELLGNVTPFYLFRYPQDFNNLKAAIKLDYSDYTEDTSKFFMNFGTVPLEDILKAAQTHDFSSLPSPMDEAGRKAYEALSHTGNGQNSDVILDCAALDMMHQAAVKSGNALLMEYANTKIDVANCNIAIRCLAMKKTRDFIQRALSPHGTLDLEALIQGAMDGLDGIYEVLERSDYAQGVPKLKESVAAFEAWCDNQIIKKMKPQRYGIDGLEPLAAFILARENEINMVKLLLSAKINNISTEVLLPRMREMYV